MEDKYHEKIEENRRTAEERTAKKRAKRLKKKEKIKVAKLKNCNQAADTIKSESESENSDWYQ